MKNRVKNSLHKKEFITAKIVTELNDIQPLYLCIYLANRWNEIENNLLILLNLSELEIYCANIFFVITHIDVIVGKVEVQI